MKARLRVLVVGQTPPPYGGQTIMVENLMNGTYRHAQMTLVTLALSSRLADMGTSGVRKGARGLACLARAVITRIHGRFEVLYYHPAGGNKGAILRDIVYLITLRPWFRATILHFHARGLVAGVEGLPRALRTLARRAYSEADMHVAPSQVVLDEVAVLAPRRSTLIPNGTPGVPHSYPGKRGGPLQVTYMNLISRAKGAATLLSAVERLAATGTDVQLHYYGEFETKTFEAEMRQQASNSCLADRVSFHGVATLDDKWLALCAADVFCVPTAWHQESFSLVLLEAASCEVAIVTTTVPGVRDVLTEGLSVILVEPANVEQLATALTKLAEAPELRQRLGQNAKDEYMSKYTLELFHDRVDRMFAELHEAQR